jgi:hypothetical protein
MNLPYALRSLRGLYCEIFVADFRKYRWDRLPRPPVRGVAHPCQARQLNWALDTLPLAAAWILRLDADELLTDDLAAEIARVIANSSDEIVGCLIKRRVNFWGRWIRFGGHYRTWLLRLWRTGMARSEETWMDEHMVAHGGSIGRRETRFHRRKSQGLAFWID